MTEIRNIPWNGFNAASTFSGCGGSSLGYKMAGFRILWASEFVAAARDTYRANYRGTILDGRDIRSVQPREILAALKMKVGNLDLLDGSPPCVSFSTAGIREKGWGKIRKYSDTKQRSDDLFFEFTRILRGLMPKTFVAENVSGLVKGTAKGYFKVILRELKSCGYHVVVKVLDAQWLGVPQSRQRVIFVGVRDDIAALGISPIHPDPLPYNYSIRDALPWSFTKGRTIEKESVLGRAYGAEWDKIKPGEASDKYFNLVKPALDLPCPTVTAIGYGAASVCHPTERRKFSIAELKRICAFPDDFILTGTYAQQWERLGNAVPPVMMRFVAEVIRDRILIPISKSGNVNMTKGQYRKKR